MLNFSASFSESDKTEFVEKYIADVKAMDVLVGIPDKTTERDNAKVSNAYLAFMHTNGVRSQEMRAEMDEQLRQGTPYHAAHDLYLESHGSPLWQVPPRPIIEPAIEDDLDEISSYLGAALKAALDGDKDTAMAELHNAGKEGQDAAQAWFRNPNNRWAPNAPSTIARKGSERPLIDTGELRKAITYVVKPD